MAHLTFEELQAGMDEVLASPRKEGLVRLVARRPGPGQREVLEIGQLDTELGLVGDDWANRPGRDGLPSLYAQVTIMNSAKPRQSQWRHWKRRPLRLSESPTHMGTANEPKGEMKGRCPTIPDPNPPAETGTVAAGC